MTDGISMLPARVITSPGPEFGDDRRLWQGIPGIALAPGGRLWALWYSGGRTEEPGNYVVMVTSGDDGQSWSAPTTIIAPPDSSTRCYDPTLWLDPTGRMWAFWAQSSGFFNGRAGVWAIHCSNPDSPTPTWTAPRRLANGVMMNKPTVLSDGEWALPVALWSHPQTLLPELRGEYGSNMVVSTNEGTTWTRRGGADVPGRWFDEHMIVELADGRLWMLVRIDGGVGQAVSCDRGATWEAIEEPAFPGPNSRFLIRRLQSGRLLLVNHEPDGGWSRVTGRVSDDDRARSRNRKNLTAMLSEDDGRTWIGGLTLDARDQVSYPDGVQAEDGRIYVIYDRERMHAREILMAVFTEDDILAGHPVSECARLKSIVNVATGVE